MNIGNKYGSLTKNRALEQQEQNLTNQLKNGKLDKSNLKEENLRKVCKNFEAIFVQRMFNEMLKTTKFKEQFGKGSGGDFFSEMFTQKISQQIADDSSIGLADQMYEQMSTNKSDPNIILENLKRLDENSYYQKKRCKAENVVEKTFITSQFDLIIETKPKIEVAKKSLFSPQLDKIIETESKIQNVDSALVKAIVFHESAGNPDAVSSRGAKGLMQLMDATASDMGVENSFDIIENLRGGIRYFKKQLKSFDNNIDKALAAYNAGPGNVKKYNGIPPFKETEEYVVKIKKTYDKLK